MTLPKEYGANFSTTVQHGVTEEVFFRSRTASYVQVTFQWSCKQSAPGVIILSGSSNTLPLWRTISPHDNVALMSWDDEQQDDKHLQVAKVLHWLFHEVFNCNSSFVCICRGVALFIDFLRYEGPDLWKCVPKVIWVAGSYSEKSSCLSVNPDN